MTFVLKAIHVRQRGDWFMKTKQKGKIEETVSPVSHIPKDKGSSELNPSRVYIHFNFNIDLIWHEVFLNWNSFDCIAFTSFHWTCVIKTGSRKWEFNNREPACCYFLSDFWVMKYASFTFGIANSWYDLGFPWQTALLGSITNHSLGKEPKLLPQIERWPCKRCLSLFSTYQKPVACSNN